MIIFYYLGNAGEPMGQPPYGYIKDPDNPKRWVVDDEAAQVVRRIYSMALEGYGTEQIAASLEQDGILTPRAYWLKKYISTNFVAVSVSMALTLVAFFAWSTAKAVPIAWYMIAGAVVLGFFVAYAAMFGFDKLKEALEGTGARTRPCEAGADGKRKNAPLAPAPGAQAAGGTREGGSGP